MEFVFLGMCSVVQRVREELKANADEQTRLSFQRFFKEKISCYGVKTATVRKISKTFWSEVKFLSKKEVFSICEELFGSGICEEGFVVAIWLPNIADKFVPSDLVTFETWIQKYVSNWATCDSFCNHTVGSLIDMYPANVGELKGWVKSENRWLKRAAAVSLIVPAKRGRFLQETFEISDLLLRDEDDMVQKGYGWLLKEASRKHQKEVFDYVVKNRKTMSRTALRYAIELMPKELKTEAMKKA